MRESASMWLHFGEQYFKSSILGQCGSRSRVLMTKKNLGLNFYLFCWLKITIYLSLGLHNENPSYKRNIQISKENIQHFKNIIFLYLFFYFVGNCFLPGSGSGSSRSNSMRILIRNTVGDADICRARTRTLQTAALWNRHGNFLTSGTGTVINYGSGTKLDIKLFLWLPSLKNFYSHFTINLLKFNNFFLVKQLICKKVKTITIFFYLLFMV